MKYLDLVVDCFHVTKLADGGMLFFPSGVHRGGYVVPSAAEFERLRRVARSKLIAFLLAFVFCECLMEWQVYDRVTAFGIYFVLCGVAWVADQTWARTQCRRLETYSDKLTYRDVMSNHARLYTASQLKRNKLGAYAFVLRIAAVAVPERWPPRIAMVPIAPFIFYAIIFRELLVVKRP